MCHRTFLSSLRNLLLMFRLKVWRFGHFHSCYSNMANTITPTSIRTDAVWQILFWIYESIFCYCLRYRYIRFVIFPVNFFSQFSSYFFVCPVCSLCRIPVHIWAWTKGKLYHKRTKDLCIKKEIVTRHGDDSFVLNTRKETPKGEKRQTSGKASKESGSCAFACKHNLLQHQIPRD